MIRTPIPYHLGLMYIKLPMNMRNRAAGQRVLILKEEPMKRI